MPAIEPAGEPAYGLASIVLPVHNQGDHLEGLVRGYLGVLTKLPIPYELVLVPNACRDHSVEVCRGLAAEHDNVRVLELGGGGWGLAVRTGLREAQGDLLCYTNSARTSPELLTLSLIYAVAYPNIMVKANRRIRDSLVRRLGSLLYNMECRVLFDLPTWDINGTPKVFPRKFEKLLSPEREDDLIDAELTVICQREGYPIIEFPAQATLRHTGESTTGFASALRMYWGAYRLWRRWSREGHGRGD